MKPFFNLSPFKSSLRAIYCLCLALTTISCIQKNQKKQPANAFDTAAKALPAKASNISAERTGDSVIGDSVIVARFLKDSIAATVTALLGKPPQNVKIYIDIKQGKNLSAVLHPGDPAANIRINQFITPDGKADGPFGNEINKRITKRGIYVLVIGHNLMAEGKETGKFQLRLIVK